MRIAGFGKTGGIDGHNKPPRGSYGNNVVGKASAIECPERVTRGRWVLSALRAVLTS